MKKSNLLFLILAFLFSATSFAQQDPIPEIEAEISREADDLEVIQIDPSQSEEVYRPNSNLWNTLKHTARDAGSVLIAPIGWKKEEWVKASAIVAGLILISTQDKNIKNLAQSIRTPTTNYLSHNVFEKFGDIGTLLPALGVSYATSLVIKNEKLKNTTLTAIESAAITSILTSLGKYTFHRTRPLHTDNQYEFQGPNLKQGNVSFPSGHTGSAFAIATVFAEAYKDKAIIPILAYSAATLAGLSRIHDNKHWFSDVAVGAALGYATGKLVSNRRLGKSGVTVAPMVAFGPQGGVNVAVTIPIRSKKKQ